MSVQANWHIGDLGSSEDSGDPFDALPVEQQGTPIDLTNDTATLTGELERLLQKEGGLFNCGVTCPIKDRPDTTCSVCPLSKADTDEEMAPLCRVGRRQEEVLTALAVARHED